MFRLFFLQLHMLNFFFEKHPRYILRNPRFILITVNVVWYFTFKLFKKIFRLQRYNRMNFKFKFQSWILRKNFFLHFLEIWFSMLSLESDQNDNYNRKECKALNISDFVFASELVCFYSSTSSISASVH